MKGKWAKYLDVFKNADAIVDGIANTIFKKNMLKLLQLKDL